MNGETVSSAFRLSQWRRRDQSFDHLVGAAEQRFGTVRPSALAVLRLMTSSTFVACWTGRSAGFSPLRMRPV